ncbi:hypothetical protein [Komagataeibacter sp. FNDCF1]|uniref:hypothetical protein n=1 Tax=Komagataeibacter sp. FNDCF1 TaxID=2878681 RepID=UPI001E58BAEA|nr:hypothetical protein [Komagataeibacter sp. FNDCF1]MCE2563113.1 hypothetical protein [Komagataeibacter sp. FNDCF1]
MIRENKERAKCCPDIIDDVMSWACAPMVAWAEGSRRERKKHYGQAGCSNKSKRFPPEFPAHVACMVLQEEKNHPMRWVVVMMIALIGNIPSAEARTRFDAQQKSHAPAA